MFVFWSNWWWFKRRNCQTWNGQGIWFFNFRREFKLIFVWLRAFQLLDVLLSSMKEKEHSVVMLEQVLNTSILIWSRICICSQMPKFYTQLAFSSFLLLKALKESLNMLMKIQKLLPLIFQRFTSVNFI